MGVLFGAILFASLFFVMRAKILRGKKVFAIFASLFAVFLMFNMIFFAAYYSFTSNYRLGPSDDYIQQEALRGYELDEISSQLNNPIQDLWVIYIGRSDCGEYQSLEASIIPFLDKHGYVLPAYYTNRDRDSGNAEDMYVLLEKYGVRNVPCVISIHKDEVAVWENPQQDIDKIMAAISAMYDELDGAHIE